MIQLIQGDARKIPLADQSVDCVVTSPPYWGLRDYGVAGQLGLEPTFDEYLENMRGVFREVWRVLKDHGTLWLNMGDGYAGSGKGPSNSPKQASNEGALQLNHGRNAGQFEHGQAQTSWQAVPVGLKPKDLIGQPWALAFALRADGWYLRSDIIWHKPAPMPESCRDRPTKAHEYLFLLSKRERYFFDQAAWLEPCAQSTLADPRFSDPAYDVGRPERGYPGQASRGAGMLKRRHKTAALTEQGNRTTGGLHDGRPMGEYIHEGGKRNRRTVWTIGSQPTPEAHFATFPEALVEPCLLAGCPKHVCKECGTPWEPIEEKTGGSIGEGDWVDKSVAEAQGMVGQASKSKSKSSDGSYRRELKGYAPNCGCSQLAASDSRTASSEQRAAPTRPGTAFDPFSGSGTVCAVANRMGYNGIGLELNEKYLEIARRRIFADVQQTPEEKKLGQRLAFA